MTSQLDDIYSGQLVWAFGSSYPYWPSIVCASESGHIKNVTNRRNPSIHVKLCANRTSDWIQLHNIFEFAGYEPYVVRKRSMSSIMSGDEFHKAFDTANNDIWRRAVVEATFLSSKNIDSRLDIFDTLNVLDSVNFELNQIACNITFEDANTERETALSVSPSKSQPATQGAKRRVRFSLPAIKPSSASEEVTKPQAATEETKRHARKSLPAPKSSSKLEEFEKDLLTYQMDSHPKEILFEGMRAGHVCRICCSLDDTNDGDLVKCSSCKDYVHNSCSNNDKDGSYIQLSPDVPTEQRRSSTIRVIIETKILCIDCQPPAICFACKEMTDIPVKKCNLKSCGRHYHPDCLDSWKQTEFVNSKFKCPLHVCHTCFPNRNDRTTTKVKFTYCLKCPTVYHRDSNCIPAGTIVLTQKQHICIRHRSESRRKVPNLDWCIRCGEEGNALICCGSCPKTFHMSCLDTLEVSDPFLCDDCVNANHPLYGQMIVAKYGVHPWWPAVIVPTFKVPSHMYDKPPKEHKFCVRFFGDYTFGWMRRSSVHFYSESETAKFLTDGHKQASAFKEAANWFDKIEKRGRDNGGRKDDGSSSSNSSVSSSSNSSVSSSSNSSVSSSNNNSNSSSNIINITDDNTITIIDLENDETQPSSVPQPPQYTKITNIITVAPAKLIKSRDEPCRCSCSLDDPCGPASDCENREMYIECDPMHRPTSSNCNNQCFERKVYAAVNVVFMGEKKGFGLVADEFINAGQLVMEYVGELITEAELKRRKSRKENLPGTQHVYYMTYSKGLYIDAEKKGNESRFVNHSCVPNCETQKWIVNGVNRIGYFALKDIKKGTEITTNYDFGRGEFHKCFCGEKKCKGVIGNAYFKN